MIIGLNQCRNLVYQYFLEGFVSAGPHPGLHLQSGRDKVPKWEQKRSFGTLQFRLEINPKTAGLLPETPGEFRVLTEWTPADPPGISSRKVSLFQYITSEENDCYAAYERSALEKFLARPGKNEMRVLYNYASAPDWRPKANIEEYCHFFDGEDLQSWGQWFGSLLKLWPERFAEAPESLDDWSWRLLWPHLKREPSL